MTEVLTQEVSRPPSRSPGCAHRPATESLHAWVWRVL